MLKKTIIFILLLSAFAIVTFILFFSSSDSVIHKPLASPVKKQIAPKVSNIVKNTPSPIPTQQELTGPAVEQGINNYRVQNNKSELSHYERLCDLAKVRVIEIQDNWSHDGFLQRSENPDELYNRFCNTPGFTCLSIGENLAKNYQTVSELIGGWAASPGHNENMLGDYNAQCVAVDGLYATSLFAKVSDKTLQQIQQEIAETTFVEYSYENVIYWETTIADLKAGLNSWDNDSGYYKDSTINLIVDYLEEMIDIANELWDGYTNSNITYADAAVYQDRFLQLNNLLTATLQRAEAEAYENCYKDAQSLEDQGYEINAEDYCSVFIE